MGASLPYPHELKHSTTWLWSVRKKCEIGQHDVQKVGKDTFTPEGKDLVVSAALMIRECPVRIIRERIGGTDVYLGDIGLVRWVCRFQHTYSGQPNILGGNSVTLLTIKYEDRSLRKMKANYLEIPVSFGRLDVCYFVLYINNVGLY